MAHKPGAQSPTPSDDGLSLGSSPAVSRSPSPELSAALRATAPPKKVVVVPAKAAAPPADAAEDDTVVVVGPISTAEWATYATRFLFLTPATDAFRSVELGELLLDESLRGQLCEPHAAAQTLTFFPACAC